MRQPGEHKDRISRRMGWWTVCLNRNDLRMIHLGMIHVSQHLGLVLFMHINHQEGLKCSRNTRRKKGNGIYLPNPSLSILYSCVWSGTGPRKIAEKKDSRPGRGPLVWLVSSQKGKWDPSCTARFFHSDLKCLCFGLLGTVMPSTNRKTWS